MNNEDVCVEIAVDSSLQQSKLSLGLRSDTYQILHVFCHSILPPFLRSLTNIKGTLPSHWQTHAKQGLKEKGNE